MSGGVDRGEEFAMVRTIRDLVKRCDMPRSATTEQDYLKKYERMIRTGIRPESARTRQTHYAYRAALVWGLLKAAKDALRKRDKAEYGSDEWKSAMGILQHTSRLLEKYPPDPERQHREKGSPGFTWADLRHAKPEVLPVRSKRRALSYLAKQQGWRDRLFERIGKKHKAAVAVCAITGARPSEIARGVDVVRDGDALLLSIQGAKLTKNSGQPERVLRVSIDSIEGRYLYALAASGPVTVSDGAHALTCAVVRAGQRAFPHARQHISPYVYRHALASALKSEGIVPEQIAQCLGQRTTETQRVYGRAVWGGGSGVLSVQASLPVRTNHRDPALALADHARAAPTPSPSFS